MISTASFLSKNGPYKAVKNGLTEVDQSTTFPKAAIFGKLKKIFMKWQWKNENLKRQNFGNFFSSNSQRYWNLTAPIQAYWDSKNHFIHSSIKSLKLKVE